LPTPNLVAEPVVSVVIPFFNRTELMIRAVRSVLAQTYSNFEILAVNDGSTDSDATLVEFFAVDRRIVYIKLDSNIGRADARNAGIRSAKGQYIAFLDSDDTWEPEKLDEQMAEMLRNGWQFSHTSYVRHDERTGKTRVVRSGRVNYRFPLVAFHCRLALPSVVLDRSILNGLGFRSDMAFSEDTHLWLILSKRTVLHGIDRPLANIYVAERTDALNKRMQIEALPYAREAMVGHPFYLAVHSVYCVVRWIQVQIVGLWR
jgi:teichuronic acid biosynthesis glycosyltransferase TuaG